MPTWTIHPTGVICHGAMTSVNWVGAGASGDPARRWRNAATSPRVTGAPGEKVVAVVPVVMPAADIHEIGSCCQGATTSVNPWAGAPVGEPSIRHRNAAACPRVTGSPGEKQVELVPVVIP